MVSYPYPYTEIGVSWSLLPSANARKSISAHSMNRRKYTNSCRAWEMWNGFQLHLPKSSLKQYMFTFRGVLVFEVLVFEFSISIWRDVIFVNAQQIFDRVRFPTCVKRYSRAWESSWEFLLFFMSPWHRRCCFVLFNSFFSKHFNRVYFLNTIVSWVSFYISNHSHIVYRAIV